MTILIYVDFFQVFKMLAGILKTLKNIYKKINNRSLFNLNSLHIVHSKYA